MKRRPKTPRIFIGLSEIAGNYTNLLLGFRAIGVEAAFLNSGSSGYKDLEQESLVLRLAGAIGSRRQNTPRSRLILKLFWVLCERISLFLVFLWSLPRFDVYIFCFGRTFLGTYDLPILKFFGKRLICQFHGADVRPPYVDGGHPASLRADADACIQLAKRLKTRLRRIEAHADVIINSTTTAQFGRMPFVEILALGKPFDLSGLPNTQNFVATSQIRILHAPSQPEAKGTVTIRKVVETLKEQGYAIDYIELTGLPNTMVLDELQRCDFVIDQLYSDIYAPSLAKEAAFCGKAAIVGGYFGAIFERHTPKDDIPPTVVCCPDDLYKTCEALIKDASLRRELGVKARNFMVGHWSAAKVAERYLQLAEGQFPSSWLRDPMAVDYVLGAGLSKDAVVEAVRNVVTSAGASGLQLSDKPDLEAKFLRLLQE